MLDPEAGGVIRFSVFEIDLRSRELRKRGVRIPLQQQPFRILIRLLDNPGELITREQLRQELWPSDTFVDFEQGLNAAVKRLRSALSDSAETPRFVETLPRRGYRFIAPVTREGERVRDDECESSVSRELGRGGTRRDVVAPAFELPAGPNAKPIAITDKFNRLHPTTPDRAPFVGRDREMGVLSAALSRTISGEGTTIVITGDAGIGKTALVDAFLQLPETLATNPIVCCGQSVEHSGAGEPYMPVIDALAPLIARPDGALHQIVDTHAPGWRSQFGEVYPHPHTMRTPPRPLRLARELGDALSAAARSRPVVLILEDVHWADPSTAELVRYLACRARRVALVIVLTCRVREVLASASPFADVLTNLEGREGCRTIELGGLDEASIRLYVEDAFSLHDESAPLASLLYTTTEGHPLFVVSLIQFLIQRGDLRDIGGQWRLKTPARELHLAVPRTVQAVIHRKLGALNQSDQRLLHHASVEGCEFSTAVLAALVGIDTSTLEERLDAIGKASGIVSVIGPERFPDGSWGTRYRFAHSMYQNVVYDGLTPSGRANLHRQVAERLSVLYAARVSAIAAQLARHYSEGREPERAFEQFLQAGDNSMTVSAAREADDHYSQAIALTEAQHKITNARTASAYYKRAIARTFLSRLDAALIDYDHARAAAVQAGEQNLVFDAHLGISYAHLLAGQTAVAAKAASALLRSEGSPPDPARRLKYLILETQLKIGHGELDEAIDVAESAVELARSLGDWHLLAFGLSMRARLAYYRADYATALSYLQDACAGGAEAMHGQADPRPLNVYFHAVLFLGFTLEDIGSVSDALTTLQTGVSTARHYGYAYWVPQLLAGLGRIFSDVGSVQTALEYDEHAASEAVGQGTGLEVQTKLNLASDCVGLKQLDRAGGLLDELDALTEQEFFDPWLWRIRWNVTAAEYALARGAPNRALELGAEGSARSRQYRLWRDVVRAECVLAEASAAEGNWSRAAEHIDQGLSVLADHAIPVLGWKVDAIGAWIHRNRGMDTSAVTAMARAHERLLLLSRGIREEILSRALFDSFREMTHEP